MVKLGAREKENNLILDGKEPRVRFGTGSEANIIQDIAVEYFVSEKTGIRKSFPVFQHRRGTVQDLCLSAQLCEHLQNVDFFIRTVNIQDEDITEDNKDVNKFYASLNNTKKHVMAGLTNVEKLDDMIRIPDIHPLESYKKQER
jgi:trimethylamine--corrinoid protein Co-methyltransferase